MSDQPGEPQKAGPAPASPQPTVPPLPPELQTANASKEDRKWAMVGHLAALAGLLPFVAAVGSILGPLIVWLVKKDSSPFVAFHAKQSMFLQIFAVVAAGILVVPIVTIPLSILVCLGAMVYAIYGAIQVSGGKDFEYYWVGPWVRRSMM
ncbi:MAG: DUF4870 domain-containing protein [Phycisphaerae bacterium]|nr:DUF4870 domain-containing protein [Phycisphaerae bacterium]